MANSLSTASNLPLLPLPLLPMKRATLSPPSAEGTPPNAGTRTALWHLHHRSDCPHHRSQCLHPRFNLFVVKTCSIVGHSLLQSI